jgi:hypothetical protein
MILTFRHEITEPATRRLYVAVNPVAKDDPRARDNGRHLAVLGFETAAGDPEDIAIVYCDTSEQRDRAEAIREQLLPHPWPRIGSRARLRATVRVIERIVDACGLELAEHERLVLDGLRDLAAAA